MAELGESSKKSGGAVDTESKLLFKEAGFFKISKTQLNLEFVKHCRMCRQHGLLVRCAQHKCPFRDCTCEKVSI
jgi:hypothetical protein